MEPTGGRIRRIGMSKRIVLLAFATVVAACSITGSLDGPVLTSPDRVGAGGMAAEVKGVVLYDESTDCLLMELEGVRYPLVWPAGTRWQEDPPAVLLASGETVLPGMEIYGGGGYLYRDQVAESAGTAVAEAAAGCAGPTGEIAFFNVGSVVEIVSG